MENPATRAYDLVSLPYKTGYPVNALWAYRFAGIDDRPGLVGQSMYYVENGNTSHNASSASVDVLEFGGQSDPKAIVGRDNQLRWNGLSLGFSLSTTGCHKMFAQPKSEVFDRREQSAEHCLSQFLDSRKPFRCSGYRRICLYVTGQ